MATSLRLPKDIENRLDALAQATGRTKTFYLRTLIEQNFDDLEAYYTAHDVLARVRAGTEKTYTLEEVERDLGLED